VSDVTLRGRVRSTVAGHADLFGVLFVVAFAVAYLSPAFVDGHVFGPYDFLSALSPLTNSAVHGVHNGVDSDVVSQTSSWLYLDWQSIHHGTFPMWNDYSLMGVPQFLNFESAVLSLPTLVAYLVPFGYALLVAVGVKLLLAGIGAYLCCRVLGGRPLGAAFAGVTYMLSGGLSNWLGWSLTDVLVWAGWIIAFLVLTYRDRRIRWLVLFAVSVAFAVYGGFPEAYLLVLVTLGLLFAAWALLRFRPVSLRGLGRVAAGAVAGLALSAPLWLPGLNYLTDSVRAQQTRSGGLAFKLLVTTISQGYYGLPTSNSQYFGPDNYYETVSYIGVLAVLLALLALRRWRSRRVVVALAVTAVCIVLIGYVPHTGEVGSLLRSIHLGAVSFSRIRLLLGLIVGLMAGLGLDDLARPQVERGVRVFYLLAGVTLLAVVGVLDVRAALRPLAGSAQSIRTHSLIWPTASIVGAVLAGLVLLAIRRTSTTPFVRGATVGGLLLAQAAFLLFAGVGINTYGHRAYPQTPATTALEHSIGGGLLGIDTTNNGNYGTWNGVGFYPNVNIGYRVREFAGHDPALPKEYFDADLGTHSYATGFLLPSFGSAALAREYGVSFILAQPLLRPVGTIPLMKLGLETLYRVPGAARFTVADPTAGSVLAAHRTSDRSWRIRVAVDRPATLVLRVTYLPGWHAVMDGHPVTVHRFDGVMAAVTVPAGTHVVSLDYWPRLMTVGIALALAAVVALAGWSVVGRLRGRAAGLRAAPALRPSPV
jgi:hypothetical protein